jgi:hypothetical protein
MFTTKEKLQCVVRELGFRHRVYARRVELGKMKQADAAHEIAVMEAIAEDYKQLAAAEEPQLL